MPRMVDVEYSPSSKQYMAKLTVSEDGLYVLRTGQDAATAVMNLHAHVQDVLSYARLRVYADKML